MSSAGVRKGGGLVGGGGGGGRLISVVPDDILSFASNTEDVNVTIKFFKSWLRISLKKEKLYET
jgi:hypothetical protein